MQTNATEPQTNATEPQTNATEPQTSCDHDFTGVGERTPYKGVYVEICRKCGAPDQEYEKDYS